MEANRGKVHEYLGMTFNFTEKLKVKNNMDDYVERISIDFPMKISKRDTAFTPAGNNIFEKGNRKFWVKKKLKSSILQ